MRKGLLVAGLATFAAAAAQAREPAPRDLHAAEINERARAGIEASVRDNTRAIDDGVIRRIGNPNVLPGIRHERRLEEDLAAMRRTERWRRIELEAAGLGPTTRRVLEESRIELWVRERKRGVEVGLDALEEGAGGEGSDRPALEDFLPRVPGVAAPTPHR